MNITAHEDLGGRWLLWDGDTYLADCGAGIEGKEKAEAIQAGFTTLREDNAMLLIALREIDYSSGELPPRIQRLLDRIREAEHPGRTLMAELTKRQSDMRRACEDLITAMVQLGKEHHREVAFAQDVLGQSRHPAPEPPSAG